MEESFGGKDYDGASLMDLPKSSSLNLWWSSSMPMVLLEIRLKLLRAT